MSTCGSKRKRSTPSNRVPSTLAAAVRSSIVSRSIGGSESGPLPTSPGHIALCSAGFVCAITVRVSCASASGYFSRIGVTRAEVLQKDERFSLAQILYAHTGGRGVGGDKQLVFRHFAEADHRRRGDVMPADRAVSLS